MEDPTNEKPNDVKELVIKADVEGGRPSFHLIRRTIAKRLPKIPDRFRVIAEQDALAYSLNAVRLGVLADAVNLTILEPNFPFIVLPGAHPDSFPDTDPFDFSAATCKSLDDINRLCL